MKKILSVILVLIMVFSMTVFAGAASDSFVDIYNSKNEDAIEFLYDLGLVEGYSVTKFGPKENLTRAEACALTVRALIENDEIYADERDRFVDVNYNAWYRDSVDTAFRNSIMHGYGNGYFGPSDYVTYAQYATILVNSLGYNSLKFAGEWPTNVEELAYHLDLYENVSRHESNESITREDAAQMLYNALWCDMVEYRNGKVYSTNVTLYEVVTEKYKTMVNSEAHFVTVLDVTDSFVTFTLGTPNIYRCHIDDYNAHAVEGHSDYVTIHFNKDYTEVYGVERIWCVEPETKNDYELVVNGKVTGHIAKDANDNIVNLEVNGLDYSIYADAEWTQMNANSEVTVGSTVKIYRCLVGCHCKVEHWGVNKLELNIVEADKATYCVNTETKEYHELRCTSIAEDAKVYVNNSVEDLIHMGYTPCADCYNDNGADNLLDDAMMVG